MKTIALEILALLVFIGLLIGIGYEIGHARAQHAGDVALARVKSDNAVCASADVSKTYAIADLEQRLHQAIEDRIAQQQVASAALQERDLQITRLQHEAAQRAETLTRLTHDDPLCGALARLPVCPAVGDRLWGKQAGAGHHAP